jgi:hypothetical protein
MSIYLLIDYLTMVYQLQNYVAWNEFRGCLWKAN